MKIYKKPLPETWEALCKRPQMNQVKLMSEVKDIFRMVMLKGDRALVEFTKKFDGAQLENILCTPEEIKESEKNISVVLKDNIRLAISNIKKFHEAQIPKKKLITTIPGVKCWREARPIEKVGIYVPGGTAPLFSTVLMLAIPAVLAGCKEIVLCSPPRKDGTLHPAILWAAKESGVTQVCKVGGAQAIAAMTYGTESVPAVYKILGPGNQYVTGAKMLAATEHVAIDMPAGPSEVLVIADEYADIEFIAADLLSQAEHGVDSQVIFVTYCDNLAEKVSSEVIEQLDLLKRAEIAEKALMNSKIIVLDDLKACMEFSNFYAPEHLIINTKNAIDLIPKVINAGSVFIGDLSPESVGDYASGTNHTLPTGGFARNYSGVSLDSYYKMITFQSLSEKGLKNIGPAVEHMATTEGLDAHRQAVSRRLFKIENL
ncbi:MAG: histidinol dehydrogenase [Candidatus Marinimicrobia bacterium]|nr:histidinol dehydrogenase [Candidatus Neomarinimicrobiota bacterium]